MNFILNIFSQIPERLDGSLGLLVEFLKGVFSFDENNPLL